MLSRVKTWKKRKRGWSREKKGKDKRKGRERGKGGEGWRSRSFKVKQKFGLRSWPAAVVDWRMRRENVRCRSERGFRGWMQAPRIHRPVSAWHGCDNAVTVTCRASWRMMGVWSARLQIAMYGIQTLYVLRWLAGVRRDVKIKYCTEHFPYYLTSDYVNVY